MIVEIKIANYRSINVEQTFSFVAEKAARHRDNLIPRKGYNLLKAAALFGANASGKSNLVKAIAAMQIFVRDSATKTNPGDPITVWEPFRLDPATRNAPSRFELTFLTADLLYTYGFAADSKRVHEEWLTAKPENGKTERFGFHRRCDTAANKDVYDVRGTLKPVADLLQARTRTDSLALSTGARENVSEILLLYQFFSDHIQVWDMSANTNALNRLVQIRFNSMLVSGETLLRQQVVELLRDADTGIDDVNSWVSEEDYRRIVGARRDAFKPEPVSELLKGLASASQEPLFTVRQSCDGTDVSFDFETEESNGTQRLFALTVLFLDALKAGHFLVIDELDCSLHPLLSRKLLGLFQKPAANPNGAQLLFTTQDPSLFDQELFRRDQVWLAEKLDKASEFFSLSDIKSHPRNTEALMRNYLSGRYGGTPYLGRSLDNLETEARK